MRQKWLILLGILLFAIVLGLMTGASNSPLAGGVISSILGIAIAALGLFTNKELEFKVKLNLIGGGLIILSAGLLIGLYFGIQYRYNDPISKENKKFIWGNQRAPSSTYEAIDWVLTNDLLISRGFTRQQVEEIYNMRIREINSRDSALKANPTTTYMFDDKYSKEQPYYKMIIGGYQTSLLSRSIANDPNAKRKDEAQ
jgi:hypothetical protein